MALTDGRDQKQGTGHEESWHPEWTNQSPLDPMESPLISWDHGHDLLASAGHTYGRHSPPLMNRNGPQPSGATMSLQFQT